jgi:hypothetical protein
VENFAKFPFCSKVVTAYGLEIVSNVITVVVSPPYVDLVSDDGTGTGNGNGSGNGNSNGTGAGFQEPVFDYR